MRTGVTTRRSAQGLGQVGEDGGLDQGADQEYEVGGQCLINFEGGVRCFLKSRCGVGEKEELTNRRMHVCMYAQLYLTFCDPMNCSPPGSSVHEILQARMLEWVVISSSRESS